MFDWFHRVRLNFFRIILACFEEFAKETGHKLFQPQHFDQETIDRIRRRWLRCAAYAERRVKELEKPRLSFQERIRKWFG